MKGLIFTYLLTALGVTSSVVSPYYGFLAYVALAILKPDALWSHSIQGGRFSLIVAASMLLSWGFRGFGNWKLGKAHPVILAFCAFWLWAVFGAVHADNPPFAWYFVEQFAKILLPFVVGLTTVRTFREIKLLAWVIVICEGYVCFEMNMWYFSGYNYLYEIGFANMDNNSIAIGFVTALGVTGFLFFNEPELWKKGILVFFGAFITHAILFSFSRGAMLATVILGGCTGLLIKKTPKHYAMFGAAALAGLILAGPQVRERFLLAFEKKNGKHEASAQSRLDLWKDCWVLFQEDPIMGCGPDHWPLHSEEFGWTPMKEAHSLWVQTATEMGIPGITLLLSFYGFTLWHCWRLLRRLKDDDPPWVGDGCRLTIASLVGFGVAAQFVSLETLEVPYYVNLIGIATVMIYHRQEKA
ncbi:MAG: O-antigen ligase family protein, partial [Planctomycetaceae bacterium]|nr:O-antigen ligase family protein [Planctomycetaceae bacterium]